jgi:hypothetical protein
MVMISNCLTQICLQNDEQYMESFKNASRFQVQITWPINWILQSSTSLVFINSNVALHFCAMKSSIRLFQEVGEASSEACQFWESK